MCSFSFSLPETYLEGGHMKSFKETNTHTHTPTGTYVVPESATKRFFFICATLVCHVCVCVAGCGMCGLLCCVVKFLSGLSLFRWSNQNKNVFLFSGDFIYHSDCGIRRCGCVCVNSYWILLSFLFFVKKKSSSGNETLVFREFFFFMASGVTLLTGKVCVCVFIIRLFFTRHNPPSRCSIYLPFFSFLSKYVNKKIVIFYGSIYCKHRQVKYFLIFFL